MTGLLVILAWLSLGIFLVYAGLCPNRAKRAGLDLLAFVQKFVPALVLIIVLASAAQLYWKGDAQSFTLIAALLVAATAAFNLISNASVKRQDDERQRRERRNDIQRAIRAEIEAHVTEFQEYDWKELRTRLQGDFAADDDYLPFAPNRQRDRLLSKMLDRIEILDDNQIGPVMRYYTLAGQITTLTADLRSTEYKALVSERRMNVFLGVLDMEETLLDYGRDAIRALGGAKSDESPAGQAEVNRTDPALSGQAEAEVE